MSGEAKLVYIAYKAVGRTGVREAKGVYDTHAPWQVDPLQDTRLVIVAKSRKSISPTRERIKSLRTRRSPDARQEHADPGVKNVTRIGRENSGKWRACEQEWRGRGGSKFARGCVLSCLRSRVHVLTVHEGAEKAISEVRRDENGIKVFSKKEILGTLPEPSPRINGSDTMTSLNFGAFAKARDTERGARNFSPVTSQIAMSAASPYNSIGTPQEAQDHGSGERSDIAPTAEVPILSASIEYHDDQKEANLSSSNVKYQTLLLRQYRLNRSLNSRVPSETIHRALQSAKKNSSATPESQGRSPNIPSLWQPAVSVSLLMYSHHNMALILIWAIVLIVIFRLFVFCP